MKTSILREELEIELQYMQKTVEDVSGLLDLVSVRPASVYDRAAAGMLLAQFYNGTENILKRISKYQGVPLPEGPSSHAILFKQFCAPPAGNMPCLFPESIEEPFIILRRFRHFVFHSYAFDLDWERLQIGLQIVEGAFSVFKTQVQSFLDGLNE